MMELQESTRQLLSELPRFCRAEQEELVLRLPDARARNRLVELQMGLVVREARRWAGHNGTVLADLIQEGAVALLEAVGRWRPGGLSLSNFCLMRIRGWFGEVSRQYRYCMTVPRRYSRWARQLGRALDRQYLKGQAPTVQELARELALSVDQVLSLLQHEGGTLLVSPGALHRQQQRGRWGSVGIRTDRDETWQALYEAAARLPDRHRRLLRRRLQCPGEPLARAGAAAVPEVSSTRAHQIWGEVKAAVRQQVLTD